MKVTIEVTDRGLERMKAAMALTGAKDRGELLCWAFAVYEYLLKAEQEGLSIQVFDHLAQSAKDVALRPKDKNHAQ